MATSNISFWQLLEKNKICIPTIQRDYAQGREEEAEKRERFLASIARHINTKEKLHLDFVYGRVKNDVFYPIDGQQRLTTLFLIHWYFAIKEKIENPKKKKLIRFVYDTRISSREFCKSIVEEEIMIPGQTGDKEFINCIKNQYWFRSSWYYDPTIKAMLIMIQAIHDKFCSLNESNVFEELTVNNCITFEVLDLGAKDFELTDELYIKMNSRGKQLTTFENFKANFIQLIDKYFKNKSLKHPIKGLISYSGYFSYKIEKEWTDLFWSFRGEKQTTDEGFSNYFEFITQLLYFIVHKDLKAEDFRNNFEQYEEVYKQEENFIFLIDSLDILYKIFTNSGYGVKENIDNFYKKLFLVDVNNLNFNSEVKLFWNKEGEFNLFEKIVNNKEYEESSNKRRNWILQFCILKHLVKFQKTEVDLALNSYVRILRNLFQATRYKSDTKFINDIRINYFGDYYPVFNILNTNNPYDTLIYVELPLRGSRFLEKTIENEINKAKILQANESIIDALLSIENIDDFGGLIHQLKPELNHSKYQDYLKAIKEIWGSTISDTLRIQALIACGFNGLYIKDTKMGETYYFGRNGNWSVILTNDEDEISSSILLLLNTYINLKEPEANKKLQLIVDDWLNSNVMDRSYKYYFLRYPTFTSKLNYFVWPNDFEIRILGTEGSNPLVAYHINPFVLTVCRIIDNKDICDENQCYLQYSGNSPLILNNGLTMICTLEGWLISINSIINVNIISKYSLEHIDEFYLLKENDKLDRIEIAVNFINDIINL